MIDWKEYERRKKQLPINLSPHEYELAIKKIEMKLCKKKKKK